MTWIGIDEWARLSRPTRKEKDQIIGFSKLKQSKNKFYAEESVPASIVKFLRGKRLDVKTACELGMLRRGDQEHAAFALMKKRVLITCDNDFLDNRKFNLIMTPVIVVVDPRNQSRRDMEIVYRILVPIIRFPRIYDKWSRLEVHLNGQWVETGRALNGESWRERHRYFRGEHQVWI